MFRVIYSVRVRFQERGNKVEEFCVNSTANLCNYVFCFLLHQPIFSVNYLLKTSPHLSFFSSSLPSFLS